jgi:hypothetical protein
MARGAQTQPDLYAFTFDAAGAVTSVAEIERNGRLDYERIERGESYSLMDGLVVKTEIDDGEREWTIFADPDGDGRWAEIAEGKGVLDMGLLALLRGEPAETAPPAVAPAGADQYVFSFDTLGRIVAVAEMERNGRLDPEKIERGESYELVNGFVVKTAIDDGQTEQTLYADPDGDGVWAEIAQAQGASLFSGALF